MPNTFFSQQDFYVPGECLNELFLYVKKLMDVNDDYLLTLESLFLNKNYFLKFKLSVYILEPYKTY